MDKHDYVAALGSLRRVCSSAGLPAERVVVGGLGMSCALGLEECRNLEVWTDPLSYELVSSVYPGTLTVGQVKLLTTWIPSGELTIRTGPWVVQGKDFSGMDGVPNRGFQHWDIEKSHQWLELSGLHLEAQRLKKWQSRAAQLMGPTGVAGYLARRRYGKEA